MADVFRTQYQARAAARYHTGVGSPLVQQYTAAYDKDGVLQLSESGQHDLYQDIQSHAASCDLAVIINRYFNGDPSALSRAQGIYADISTAPGTIHEAANLMRQAEADFLRLPVDIKEKFGNDPMRFLSTLGSDEWMAAMQIPKSQQDEPVDLVKDAVQKAEEVRVNES